MSGLSSAAAAARLARFGPNVLVPRERWAAWKRLIKLVADPMALMLAVTGAVYFAVGEQRDAIILWIALVPVLAVDVVLEARSRRALEALRRAVAPRARVERDGVVQEIPTADLVPDDLLLLREGDLVLADARVQQGDNLTVDEAHLTGESEPQPRGAGEALRAGSRVLGGRARAIVTVTGASTSYGKVASLVSRARGGETALQKTIGRLVRGFALVALAIASGVFALGLARGQTTTEAFVSGVSLAMAAVPEEFPLVFTLFLTLSAFRLSRRGVLVRGLTAVESLGSTTVICVDKTGTLTVGNFQLADHVAIDGDDALLEAAALACEPEPDDAMDQAILAHCREHGLDVTALHAQWHLVGDHPFETAGRHMTHVWQRGDRWSVVMKGAFEGVAEHCGTVADLTRQMSALAASGSRVLAVARRDGVGSPPATREEAERGLVLVGLLGFRDPIRPEAAAAVADCLRAGIRVKVVTGDHALTARAVAAAAGIAVRDDEVITGEELGRLEGPERRLRVARATILARVQPDQKYTIVDDLLASGEVVAMTGDGINDAPALRRASIGVSMGPRATEVARDAAALVLLRDDLGALAGTIREGRRVFVDLQRAFLFLIAFHVPVIALAIAAPLLGLPLVLLPIHLVVLELMIHPIAALAFEGGAAAEEVMARPPRHPSAPLLPRRALARALVSGGVLAAVALALFWTHASDAPDVGRGLALTCIVSGGIALVWAERAGDRPWFRVPLPREPRFWIVMLTVVAFVPALVAIPAIATAVRIARPDLGGFALAVAAGLGSVAWRMAGRRQ